MAFKPRTSAPSTSDPNWIHTSKGGKNSCILISGKSDKLIKGNKNYCEKIKSDGYFQNFII